MIYSEKINPKGSITLQPLFALQGLNCFPQPNNRITVKDFVCMAQELGGPKVDETEVQEMFQATVLNLYADRKTEFKFEEFYTWWSREMDPPKSKLDVLKYKLRSRALLRTV